MSSLWRRAAIVAVGLTLCSNTVFAAGSIPPVAVPARVVSGASGALRHLDLSVPGDEGPGELLVAYKDAVPETDKASTLRQAGVQSVGRTRSGVARVKAASQHDALARLRKDARVKYVEPNYQRKAAGMPATDPLQPQQWFHDFLGTQQAWGHFVPANATPVTVAVLDTGVAADHPDLAGRVLPGHNFTGDSFLGADLADTTDREGHGTHVSGIIAAVAGNGKGGAGVAGPANVMILPVKVLGDDGSGTVADIADGIYWAVDHGARVINLSLGGPGHSQTEQDAIEYAVDHGVLVVVAAGNESTQAQLSDPANQAGVITVSAIDEQGKLAWFSNYGSAVDVAAPGVGIVSTVPSSVNFSGYDTWSGTSMAAPTVSATAALIAAGNPTFTRGDIEAHLLATLKRSSFWDPQFGYGQLDASRVVDTSADPSPYAIRIKGLWRGQQVFGPVQVAVERNSAAVSRVEVRTGSGRQVAAWDVSTKPDLSWWTLNPAALDPNDALGQSSVVFAAYDGAGTLVTQQTLNVDNRAAVSSGIRVQMLGPDGRPLTGTVDAYQVDEHGAQFTGEADIDTSGWANLTAPTVWDGRSYTLVAHAEVPGKNGPEQAVWVQDNVTGPATLTLDSLSLRPVDVTVKDLNADKLSIPQANAVVWGSPVVVRGQTQVAVIGQAPYVMGRSGTDGKSRVWLSDGLYNVAAWADNPEAGQNFYLLRRNVAVSSKLKTLTLDETGSITATYAPTAPVTAWAGLQIWDDTQLAPTLDATRPMRVPPDTEASILWVEAFNQNRDHLYDYYFFPTDTIRLGDNHQLTEGRVTESTLRLTTASRGGWLYGETNFSTPYGWTLAYGAVSTGDGGSGLILGRPSSVAMLKTDPVTGSGPKPIRKVRGYQIQGNRAVQMESAQSASDMQPKVSVTHAGAPVATFDADLAYGGWRIPADAAGGDYLWTATLDAGPLGPPSTGGVVTLAQGFTLAGTLAADQIQVNVKGRDGSPVPADQVGDVTVALYVRTDAGWTWTSTRSLDASSKAVFSGLDPAGQYLAAAWSGTFDSSGDLMDAWITWQPAQPGAETLLDASTTVATTWSSTLDGITLPAYWELELSQDGAPFDTLGIPSQGSIQLYLPAGQSLRTQLLSDSPSLFIDQGPAVMTAADLVVNQALSTKDGSLKPLTIASANINPAGHRAAVDLYLSGSDMLKHVDYANWWAMSLNDAQPLSILVPSDHQFSFYAYVYQDLNEQGWIYSFYGDVAAPTAHRLGENLTLHTEWTNRQTTAQDGAAKGWNVLYDDEGHVLIWMEASPSGFGIASRAARKAGLISAGGQDGKARAGMALGKALAERNQQAYREAAAEVQRLRSHTDSLPSVKLTDASGRTLAQASGYDLDDSSAGYGYWTLPIANQPALGLPGGTYTLTSQVQTATGTITTDPQRAAQTGIWITPAQWSPARGNLTIGYQFPPAAPQAVTVAVYNAAGQLVAKPGDITPEGASGSITWNGRSSSGANLPKGIYRVLALPQGTPPAQIAAAANYLSADCLDINVATIAPPKPNKLPAAIGAGGLTVTGTAAPGTHLVVQRKLMPSGAPETVDLGQQAEVPATGTFRFDISFPQDGSYTLQIMARDSYGNQSQAATAGPVLVDTTRPTLAVTKPLIQEETHLALSNLTTTSVTGTTEAGASVYGVVRGQDTRGRSFEKSVKATASTAGAFTLAVTLGDGVTHVELTAVDKVGNRADPVSFGVVLDKKAPGLNAQVAWNNQWLAAGARNTYTVGNTQTSPVDIYFTADEPLQGNLPIVTQQVGSKKTILPVTEDAGRAHVQVSGLTGNATIMAVARDLAGNQTTVTLTIKSDTAPPLITISKPAANAVLYVTTGATDTALGIEGTSTEPLAFLGTELTGPGQLERVATRVTFLDARQTRFRVTIQAPEEGTYTVRLIGYDAVGNRSVDSALQKSANDTRTIVVDGAGPDAAVDPVGATSSTTRMTVWTTPTDALSGVAKVEYVVKSGGRTVLQGGRSSLIATLTDATGGRYKGTLTLKANAINEITVRVTDKAGNVTEAGPFTVTQGNVNAAISGKTFLMDGFWIGPGQARVRFDYAEGVTR